MDSSYFAPTGRAESSQLTQQQQAVSHASFITTVLHSVPEMILVLNEHRQIVGVNKKLLDNFGITDQTSLVGLRPGEAVNCIHCDAGPDGCGTSETCSTCGAALTILASKLTGEQADGECRITLSRNGGTALDMEVTATPLSVSGIPLTILVLKDIGAEKRREVLEHTFFHDVLNTVGGIRGIADLLNDSENLTPQLEAEFKLLMVDLADSLAEEITQQRRLLSAERGEYVLDLKDVNLQELLDEVSKLYGNHIRTPDRTVILENVPDLHIVTDRAMLRRVVGNMLLNALEATPVSGSVRVFLEIGIGHVRINVSNAGEIPRDVQLRIFKRSFSTKSASGRGIGTYSMKLFGERYLGGAVSFKCDNGSTLFSIQLPLVTAD